MKIKDTILEIQRHQEELRKHKEVVRALEEQIAPTQKKITQLQIDNAHKKLRQRSTVIPETKQPEDEQEFVNFVRESNRHRDKERAEKAKKRRKKLAKDRYKKERNRAGVNQKFYIPDPIVAPPTQIEFIERLETSGLIHEVLRALSRRERMVLRMHYFEEMSLSEIGQCFSITYGRIYQIHNKALRKLRHPDRLNRLKESCPRNIFYTPEETIS